MATELTPLPRTNGTLARFLAVNNGRELQLVPMTFGKVRLTVGPLSALYYDDGW